MSACADLQRQCLQLLSQLKTNQASLKESLGGSCQAPAVENGPSALENNLEARLMENKPEYARQKLRSIMKTNGSRSAFQSVEAAMTGKKDGLGVSERLQQEQGERSWLPQGQAEKAKWDKGDLEAMHDYFQSRVNTSLLEGRTDSFLHSGKQNEENQPASKPLTPNSVQRRRIIDQNVRVDSKLTDAELRDLEMGVRSLNFSYSQFAQDDDTTTKLPGYAAANTNQNANVDEEAAGEGMADRVRALEAVVGAAAQREGDRRQYEQTLEDQGNNRRLNQFIRDTTIRPHTTLNSTLPSSASSFSRQVG
jgi:hypothetical protein